MKKLYIVGFVAIAALGLLAVGLATTRALKVAAANREASPRSAKAARSAPQDDWSDSADDDAPKVIRFASNPEPMPPFLVNDVEGRVLSTAEFRGKVVIVNFWATWCPPCREEIPEMIDLANRYKDRLQIIGISEDDDATAEEVRDFAREEKINYPIVMGSSGVSAEYGGVPALPTSFLVNTDGRVVVKHVGLFPAQVYDREIRALLGQHVDAPIETFVDDGQIFLKNAANATELPGVSFKGLKPEQKRLALKRMNSENCTCGCKLTIAQCRIIESTCATSEKLAAQVLRQVGASRPASSAAVR
ncbi:MAG: TlpA disulfide reductase family protein [Candidatus Acidoferrales bacterium]|nr:TlpA disulfide reductase family protein [Candidatus Acidoferrales bacterium]